MGKLRQLVLALLFGAGIFGIIVFLFAATSVLQSFQLFPQDSGGGFSLFLIELVVGFFAASIAGLVLLHRLSAGQ